MMICQPDFKIDLINVVRFYILYSLTYFETVFTFVEIVFEKKYSSIVLYSDASGVPPFPIRRVWRCSIPNK